MDALFSILRSLRRTWKLWTLIPAAASLLVFGLTRNQTRTWVSTGLLSLNTPHSKQLSITSDALPQFEMNQRFENLIELFRSKRNADLAVARAAFARLNGDAPFFVLPEGDAAPGLDSLRYAVVPSDTLTVFSRPVQAWLDAFAALNGLTPEEISGALSVNRVRNSNFIRVTYKAEHPEKAAFMATVLSETLADENARIARSRTLSDRAMFEKLVSQARRSLDGRIKALEAYKVEHSVINLGEHTKAIVNQIVGLELQLAHQKELKASGQRAMDRLHAQYTRKDLLPVNVEANAELLDLKSRLTDITRQQIGSAFESDPVRARRDSAALAFEAEQLKDRIAATIARSLDEQPFDIRATRQEIVSRYVVKTLDVEMASEAIPQIEAEIKRVMQYAGRFAALESTIGTLSSEIHVAQESYLILLNKLNLAKTMEQGQGDGDITMIDRPTVPLKPEPSKRMLLVVLAGVGMAILIIALLVLTELLDRSIMRAEQYEAGSPFPVLAVLPGTEQAGSEVAGDDVQQILTHQLQMLRKPLLDLLDHHPVVLWTAALRSEDVHTPALDAARAIARTGGRILLVNDGPAVTLDLPGISVQNLDQDGRTPYERQSMRLWQAQFATWRREFDAVFILTLPATASAAWVEWLDLATHTVHVFAANRLLQEVDRRLFKRLQSVDTPVLGTVITGAFVDKMEALVGDLPKRRSAVRIFSKKLLTRSLGRAA